MKLVLIILNSLAVVFSANAVDLIVPNVLIGGVDNAFPFADMSTGGHYMQRRGVKNMFRPHIKPVLGWTAFVIIPLSAKLSAIVRFWSNRVVEFTLD